MLTTLYQSLVVLPSRRVRQAGWSSVDGVLRIQACSVDFARHNVLGCRLQRWEDPISGYLSRKMTCVSRDHRLLCVLLNILRSPHRV